MSSLFRRADRRTNFKLFLLAGFVGSELMWIIRTENKRVDFERQSSAQIKITRSIIDRLKKGEKVDVEKELLGASTPAATSGDDSQQSVSSIFQNIEAMDSQWSQAGATNVLKSPPPKEPSPSDKSTSDKSTGKGSGFL